MPFGYDLQQVFMMIMQKTMWDCNSGFGGFGGGNFMNSCWGNGFSMQGGWGDYCQFNNAQSISPQTPLAPAVSTLSVEQKVDADMAKDKFTSLRKAVQDYITSLGTTREDRITKETFNSIGTTYSAENLSKLQEFYDNHKTDILKNIDSTTPLDFLDSNKEKIEALTTMGLQTKLTDAQIADLKKVDGVTEFLEKITSKIFGLIHV